MNVERPKVGIGIAVIKENKVLLGRRKGAHGSGDWAFPGGHLEFGEIPEDCVQRELMEETGLYAVSIVRGPWTNDMFAEDKHYVTLFMFVTEFLGQPELLEPNKCEGWDWFEWDNLPKPLFKSIQTLVNTVGVETLQKADGVEHVF